MGDENYDIYGDLDEALIEPLEEDKLRQQEAELLKIQDEKRSKEEIEEIFSKLRVENGQLKKNMSLLLVTAKKEIERKDQQIKELRRELDSLIFRKTNVIRKKMSEKFTQTYIPQQAKFTQTLETKLSNENGHHLPSRDPVERLKIRNDRDLSRERRRSRDRNRESPKRHPRERTIVNERREKSPDRRRKHNNDTNKLRSRHESPEKSHKKRSSSREKDLRRDVARSKSPRRERNKIEKIDLREKLLKRNNRVIITDIKNDGDKIIVESKISDEHENVINEPRRDFKSVTEVNCEKKLENLERDEHTKKRDASDEFKLKEKRATEGKCDQKDNDMSTVPETSKSKPENIKTKKESRKVETPKKSTSRKKLEKRKPIEASENVNDLKSPELLKILKDEPELDQSALKQTQPDIIKSPEKSPQIKIDQDEILPDTKNEAIIQSNEEIRNSSIDVNELFVPDVSNEVELTSEFVESEIFIEPTSSDNSKGINSIECQSDVATNKELPKLHLVPIEIGPQYCYKNTTDVSSDILELPLSNEEVIFDSRNLSTQETPIKTPENESFDSTKENSIDNNSLNTSASNKSKKRKIVTTEVEDDGTVVFTIVRKKKRKTAKN